MQQPLFNTIANLKYGLRNMEGLEAFILLHSFILFKGWHGLFRTKKKRNIE